MQMNGWEGLHVAAAECSYRKARQAGKKNNLYMGFMIGFMLDEIIRELTTKNSDQQVTSEGVLTWAKRIKAQRAQAAVLNDITELHQFDKIKIAQKPKESQLVQTTNMTGQRCPCRYCSEIHTPRQCPAYGKTCASCGKMGHFRKVCQSWRDQAVHKLEVEGEQKVHKGEIETVSVDSVHLNKNQSLITANLEMQAGKNVIETPYKIDTGSEGNIIMLYILKKMFKNMTEEQL